MALNALKIETSDLVGKLVSQLTNRPTDPRYAGGDGMTAGEVKARQDALGLLLTERFNALVDALVADPAVNTDALAKNIQVYLGDPAEEDPMSLETALATLVATLATKYALPEGGIPAADLASAVTNAINEKYVKPGTGIPATDLETAVQTSLGKADSAYQKPSGGIPATDLASAVKAILDSAVSQSEFAPVKALAENADKVLTAANYEAVATLLNAAAKTDYKVGQKILIGAGRVPDLWIYFVHDAAVSYTYTTALAFQTALENGTLQIGYYALRPLEAKTELEDYPTKTEMNSAISGNIDATLSTTGKSADAKAVGDAIDALIDALVDGVMAVAEATYAESATYAQQAGIASQINTDREIEGADTACPPVVFGTVGGNSEVQNGKMPFPELRGHTIKWNQLAKVLSSTNWVPYKTDKISLAFDESDNKVIVTTLTTEESATGMEDHMIKTNYHLNIVAGHKCLIFVTFNLLQGSNIVPCFELSGSWTNDFVNLGGNLYGYILTAVQSRTDARLYLKAKGIKDIGDSWSFENPCLFDLTNIYGGGNEPSTVAEFVRDFPIPYYEYNAGTLLSSKSNALLSIGRNQWDEEWEVGSIDASTGEDVSSSSVIRSKNIIPVLTNEKYFFVCPASTGGRYYFYDATGAFLSSSYITENSYFTVPLGAIFMRFTMASQYGTTYNHDICLYDYWETPNLPYVPYQQQIVSLPNIELRSAGSAYDVAYQEGGGKRRIGVVDLGTLNWVVWSGDPNIFEVAIVGLKSNNTEHNIVCSAYPSLENGLSNWSALEGYDKMIYHPLNSSHILVRDTSYSDAATFKAAMSGVMLYYELATETDITVEENPGWTEYAEIDNFGTVKFNQDPAQDIPVPQAYFVRYTINLVEFLDSVGERAGFDASKIALLEDIVVPDAPTTDGSYTLKVTVSSGTPTYSWVADE